MEHRTTINRLTEIGLRVVGIWPETPYANVNRAFWFISFALAQVFQYQYIITCIGTIDLSNLMDDLSTTLSYSLVYTQLIIFWTNRRIFHDILSAMATDYTKDVAEFDRNIRTMTKMVYLAHRWSNLMFTLCFTAVMLYCAGVVVVNLGHIDTDGDSNKQFFLRMKFPFEANDSPVYEIVMVTQFFHEVLTALLMAVINGLLIALVFHAAGQIDLIREGFEEVSRKSTQSSSTASILNILVIKHQKIIQFSNNIENLYCYIVLMQFFWNTLIICALGFVIMSSLDDSNRGVMLVKSVCFYISISSAAFTHCYAGDYLTEKSKMIGDAAYESLWYNLKQREAKLLLFLMLRSQQQLKISIGKFADLSLSSFTAVMKASASYISVLNAMY